MSQPSITVRTRLTKPPQGSAEALRDLGDLAAAATPMARNLTLGLQKLALVAQKERFSGKGPFPVSAHRLGIISGRLRRDIHAETVVATAPGTYRGAIGAAVEYFGAHKLGFEGRVQIQASTRKAVADRRNTRVTLTRSAPRSRNLPRRRGACQRQSGGRSWMDSGLIQTRAVQLTTRWHRTRRVHGLLPRLSRLPMKVCMLAPPLPWRRKILPSRVPATMVLLRRARRMRHLRMAPWRK